jgi:hypothetical protein
LEIFREKSVYYHKTGKVLSDICVGDSGKDVEKFEEHLSLIKNIKFLIRRRFEFDRLSALNNIRSLFLIDKRFPEASLVPMNLSLPFALFLVAFL